MKMKAILHIIGFCILLLAVLTGAAAQTGERGLEVEELAQVEATIAVFPHGGDNALTGRSISANLFVRYLCTRKNWRFMRTISF
jgi:hypothetical protein